MTISFIKKIVDALHQNDLTRNLDQDLSDELEYIIQLMDKFYIDRIVSISSEMKEEHRYTFKFNKEISNLIGGKTPMFIPL